MAALTTSRDNKRNGFDAVSPSIQVDMAASTTIYAGAMVAVNASGLAVPAATGSTRVIGVADETKVSGASGTTTIRIRRGSFWFNNKGGDLVTQALLFTTCYVEDDNTVRLTATSSIAAGKVLDVDSSQGVLVEII